MKTIRTTASVCCLLVLFSCSGGGSSDQSEAADTTKTPSLYDQVMAVHDEMMPKMDDIYQLQTRLKEQLEKAQDLPEEKRQELETSIKKLDSASRSMMVWMRQFNPESDSLKENELENYYRQQLDKVEHVKDLMVNAIKEAQEME